LDRPDVSSGEALAGLLRPGNAGSNTAADHIAVLDMALQSLPPRLVPVLRAGPGCWPGRTLPVLRTTLLLPAGREAWDQLRLPGDRRRPAGDLPCPEDIWEPAVEADGEPRAGAFLAELTRMLDLSPWPEGSRVIVRCERPHPGAALTLFEAQDGWRYTAL